VTAEAAPRPDADAALRAGRNVVLDGDDSPGVELDGLFAPAGGVLASPLPAGAAATTIRRGPPSPEGIAAAQLRGD
jgi:hypothetical protein